MSAVAVQERPQRRLIGRVILWSLVALLALPGLGALAVWSYGPYWIAPVEDFAQGPGGAVAYISLLNQIQQQAGSFWSGGDLKLVMTESEFSGMLSSALLSGRTDANPIRKVRGDLVEDEIRVETVMQFQDERVPARYRGPVGLKVRLNPVVAENGEVQFAITRATVGRIPVPRQAIQWAGRFLPAGTPGLNLNEAMISLPLGDMIAAQLGRRVEVKDVAVDNGKLSLVLSLAKDKK